MHKIIKRMLSISLTACAVLSTHAHSAYSYYFYAYAEHTHKTLIPMLSERIDFVGIHTAYGTLKSLKRPISA